MTYRLKNTVLAPTSTTVDLAKHKYNPLEHPHAPAGTSHGGEFISTHSSFSSRTRLPGGKHLSMSGETASSRFKSDDLEVTENTKRFNAALQRAEQAGEGTTEQEHALEEAAAHLEAMNRRVQTAQKKVEETKKRVRLEAADTKVDRTLYRLKTTDEPPKVKKTGTYVEESVKDARNVALGRQVADLGARLAGAAAGLLGAVETEHFTEAFHKILENPMIESGINVAVALVISALVGRIRSALKKRRDRKIAEARGDVQPS